MNLYQRIKARREELGLSQEELAYKLGYKSRSTINKIEMGKNDITQSKIKAFADALQTTPGYLMGLENTECSNNLPKNAIPVDLSTFVKIPVYGEVSAGMGCLAENNIIGYEFVSPDSINKYEDYFFLKVKGDSMEPEIRECDLALIQKCTSVDSGSVAVVIIDDENGVIKKVNYGDDWIELVSFNPYYPPRRFEGAGVQRIMVVGLVKQIIRKFN